MGGGGAAPAMLAGRRRSVACGTAGGAPLIRADAGPGRRGRGARAEVVRPAVAPRTRCCRGDPMWWSDRKDGVHTPLMLEGAGSGPAGRRIRSHAGRVCEWWWKRRAVMVPARTCACWRLAVAGTDGAHAKGTVLGLTGGWGLTTPSRWKI